MRPEHNPTPSSYPLNSNVQTKNSLTGCHSLKRSGVFDAFPSGVGLRNFPPRLAFLGNGFVLEVALHQVLVTGNVQKYVFYCFQKKPDSQKIFLANFQIISRSLAELFPELFPETMLFRPLPCKIKKTAKKNQFPECLIPAVFRT